jgi:hypothetical protein
MSFCKVATYYRHRMYRSGRDAIAHQRSPVDI